MRVVFVHGACVQDGTWWWHRTAELLQARGVASVAPALPSCGEGDASVGAAGPGLDDDVIAVRTALSGSDEPTVLVAHSYGGIVGSEAAAELAHVRHLLLISSYLPEVGESLGSFGGPEPAPFLDVDARSGTLGVRSERFVETFMQDCSELADDGAARLTRQSLSVVGQPVRAAAWKQRATTYLVCSEDRGTPPEAQRRFAQRAARTVEMNAGHHPFLSQPDAVAELVLTLA